jgi:hypothetical protein
MNFISVRSVGEELFHANGRTDVLTDTDESNSRFSQFCESA